MISLDNEDAQRCLKELIDLYYCVFTDAQRVDTEIYLTDSLNKTHLQLRPDLADIYTSMAEYKDSDQANGRMVPPIGITGTFSILVNSEYMLRNTQNGSYSWAGTLAHELTHAIDFFEMARMANIGDYTELLGDGDYDMFKWWTEYHARRCGYFFLRKIIVQESVSTNEQIAHILETELPFQIKVFADDYHSTACAMAQIDATMQFLGRLSIWKEVFPTVFTASTLKQIWGENIWLENIFNFLIECKYLKLVFPRFDEMKAILGQNWIFPT